MTYYLFDEYGRYAGVSEEPTERSTSIAPDELTADSNWNGYHWVFVSGINDVHIAAVSVIPSNTIPPTLSVSMFLMLWSRAERVKARELRTNNLDLEDIWARIDDTRTTEVNLALPSVQDDIEYTLNALKAAGMDIEVTARKAEILSGQLA